MELTEIKGYKISQVSRINGGSDETFFWFEVETENPDHNDGKFAVVERDGEFRVVDANLETIVDDWAEELMKLIDEYEYQL